MADEMKEPGYEPLARILLGAYNQSAKGKGRVRHANDKTFDTQPIMEIARMVGLGGHTYQVCKKAQEATGMATRGDYDAAIAELGGVIVYAAAAILLTEENRANAIAQLEADNPLVPVGFESEYTDFVMEPVVAEAEWVGSDSGIEDGGLTTCPRSDPLDRG
jgi:hypothetical protein